MPVLEKKLLTPINQDLLEQSILPKVTKPGRYMGLEFGAFKKDINQAKANLAMIFPDLYEIGVSNFGHKLLYSLINNHPDYMCDRAYAPAKDMFAQLKENNMPLYGMESLVPLKDFDCLAFTLQYELNYTTILGVLESAQLAFRTTDRNEHDPILIAGGPGSANPAPLVPFFDAFILGDGEEVLLEIMEILEAKHQDKVPNSEIRKRLAKVEGIYVPTENTGARKRIVDITQQQIDVAPLIPHVQSVHDRVVVEARRGCDRMCRFCQPCFINLPVREQSVDRIREEALKGISETGYEECSLLSLSIADYSQLKPLITDVTAALREKRASISLPSQRADRFDLEVAEAVQQVRKSTLTFAPEAGTERLRAVINKNLTEAEIMKAVTESFQAGWNKVKLYFMIGLPTETDKDLVGIVQLIQKMKAACDLIQRDVSVSRKKHLEVNVTLSNFVSKPHTPFQWWPQDSLATLHRKIRFLKDAFHGMRGVKLNFTDPELSKLECLISKGDVRIADVIERAYEKGGYLDAWEENMTFPDWYLALEECGIEPDEYTGKQYCGLNDELPWDNIGMGLEKDWLKEEYQKSTQAEQSDPCFVGCNTCGVCTNLSSMPVFMPSSAVATLSGDSRKFESREFRKQRLFPEPIARVRLNIQKMGGLKYLSHLDWLRMLHRAVIRAELPVAYTQGFNPTARLAFGPALPLFVEGESEWVDIELTRNLKPEQVLEALNPQLPNEGKILSAQAITLFSPSIDKQVRSVNYIAQWTCKQPINGYTLHEKFKDFSSQLATKTEMVVEIEKKGTSKSFDIKPHILNCQLASDETLTFSLKVDRQTAQVKPQWVLDKIDPDAQWQVTRQAVVLENSK